MNSKEEKQPGGKSEKDDNLTSLKDETRDLIRFTSLSLYIPSNFYFQTCLPPQLSFPRPNNANNVTDIDIS